MNKLTKGEWLRLSIIFLPNLMISLNTYMLQVALPEIQHTLGVPFNDAQFILTGYSLGLATCLIISSFLGNRLGQKKVLLGGVLLFLILSIIGGSTTSANLLIMVRIGQGVSGALIQPQVMVLMREGFSKEKQPIIFSVYGMVIGLGFTFGLLLGGLIMEWNFFGLGWRNIFYFNIPICLIILCLNYLIPRKVPMTTSSLDIPGSFLLMLGSFVLVYHIIYFSGVESSVFIVIGLVILLIFWQTEQKRKQDQKNVLVDFLVFKEVDFFKGIMSVFSVYMSMFGFFFLITYYAQLGLSKTVYETGFIFLPLGIGFTVASITSSKWLKRLGNRLLMIGTVGMIVSILLLMITLILQPDLYAPFNLLLLCLYGIFLGITTTPLIGIILMKVSSDFSALASSIINMMMYFSNIIGVAFIGGFFKRVEYNTHSYLNAFQLALIGVIICLLLTAICFYSLFHRKRNSAY
ncbi:MAG: MFS transporter [Vagococcus sp.]|uniref:MFS transporter n=1 Tax=Vagococcus sp. TaxID=1933889 RepID=UPI002FCC2C85